MKPFLVELDDKVARDLERVAPAKDRKRAEFVRMAIRRAVDLALDRRTEEAYRARPQPAGIAEGDLTGWDEHNALARKPAKAKARRKRSASAA
ncbi:MAG: hypothetical protein ACRELB_18515 [Polyangiaceae bacterium]